MWMMLDLLSLAGGAWLARTLSTGLPASWSNEETTLASAGSLMLLLTFVIAGVYARKHHKSSASAATRIVVLSMLAWAAANRAAMEMGPDRPQLFGWLDSWLAIFTILMLASRLALDPWINRARRSHLRKRRVAVAGEADYLNPWLRSGHDETSDYAVIAIYNPDATRAIESSVPILVDFDSLVAKAKNQDFDELWLALSMSSQEEISRYVTAMQHHFVDIRLFADVQNLPMFNPAATTLAGTTFVDLVTSPSAQDDAWSKSVFDRLFALAALLLLSPALIAIAVAVKCTSPGPVLFRQRRKGVDGREFTILKFRSMRVHQEITGRLTQASKNDKRITPIGRILRKTSLDELPQFINVLLGHMSVVGPRPHAIEHDDFYMRLIDGYMYRYRIKPGITGWAQINGARGETEKVESMTHRVALDLFYIQHWSFWLDLKIVATTVFKGFGGKDAY
ncbi:undecaprenyl-phosphate glucose phosphotransferase [Dyella mobilis]|uniref:Undecaprenyl-phosphate glucose phosphotransferase n=1 Tax=Dyella mobilis TaxID=1849582 RepID=A0ABS2KHK8_9GAMM|nr:undecaprenyl-phosphate glucose phosphotransferase [Dyella mobilis]MBM7129833.1 undecaprenyl-phosphate glucose phosphotransferase [Dyella mobilis]